MTTQKYTHKNINLPSLPDHSESRKMQNIVLTSCLGLGLLCAISMVLIII